MPKDAYYFPHDYNARNDRKIAALVKKHKSSGYGVFWITCEMMHEEDGSIEFDDITFGAIAKDANEDIEVVRNIITDCIKEFKLFKMDDDIVISGRVSRNLEHKKEAVKQRSEAGKRSANARRMFNGRSTSDEQNSTYKIKENKIKEKGIEFIENNTAVRFKDGSTQKLGECQLLELSRDNLKPFYVEKGKIE